MEADAPDGGGDEGGDERSFYDRKHTCVVKKCLVSALSPELPPHARQAFLGYVQQVTEMMSRMSRRATMLMLYYVVRRFEDGLPPPDFDAQKDAYWKQWLRVGLDEFDREFPAPDVEGYFEEVRQWIGTTVGCGPPPKYFDRVLGHAAKAFKTAALNNQTAHFLKKIQRLCKAVARSAPGGDGPSGFELFEAFRGKGECDAAWPPEIVAFVGEGRTRLGLKGKEVLWDDTQVPTIVRMSFHWWMQQRFATLGVRKNMLSPVSQVTRAHVRLDATLLYLLAWKAYAPPDSPAGGKPTASSHPDPEAREAALAAWKAGRLKRPTKTSHPDAEERRIAAEAYARQKAAEAELAVRVEEYKSRMALFKEKHPTYSALSAEAPDDPYRVLNRELPAVKALTRNDRAADVTDEQWKAMTATRHAEQEVRKAERSARMRTPDYVDAAAAYRKYEARVHGFAATLFRKFDDKNPKKGWVPSTSICTDGVSVSIAYERLERVYSVSDAEFGERKAAAKAAKAEVAALPPKDDYDPDAWTIADGVLVLGVDPGRTSIVTVVCIDRDGKKHSWRLSRGQYYAEGLILREDRRQTQRYEPLRADFAGLTAGGGSLRASTSAELRAYFERYASFEAKWWSVALTRTETRAKMQRYIGKKAVLARFFALLRKDAEALMSKSGCAKIDVAYGSAGLNMASTGRGEAAVPTGGTYRACCEAFKGAGRSVTPTFEHNTSCTSFQTGKRYEKVYKRRDGATGKEVLMHFATRSPPRVSPEDLDAEAAASARAAVKARVRRGGKRRSDGLSPAALSHAPSQAPPASGRREFELRYRECRGLRFCPETRMFYGRDERSAAAIAGLRRLELLGFGRPSAFRRQPKETRIEGSCEEGVKNPPDDAAASMTPGGRENAPGSYTLTE